MCVHTAPGPVSHVSVESVNSSSLYISWGAASPANGNTTHYLVWVNSSSQQHMTNTTATDMRTVAVQGLSKLNSLAFEVWYVGCLYF